MSGTEEYQSPPSPDYDPFCTGTAGSTAHAQSPHTAANGAAAAETAMRNDEGQHSVSSVAGVPSTEQKLGTTVKEEPSDMEEEPSSVVQALSPTLVAPLALGTAEATDEAVSQRGSTLAPVAPKSEPVPAASQDDASGLSAPIQALRHDLGTHMKRPRRRRRVNHTHPSSAASTSTKVKTESADSEAPAPVKPRPLVEEQGSKVADSAGLADSWPYERSESFEADYGVSADEGESDDHDTGELFGGPCGGDGMQH